MGGHSSLLNLLTLLRQIIVLGRLLSTRIMTLYLRTIEEENLDDVLLICLEGYTLRSELLQLSENTIAQLLFLIRRNKKD